MEPFRFSVISKSTNSNGPRLGALKHSMAQIDTPALMFYTKCGSVPNVSREVFEKILPNDRALFNFPLPSNLNFYEPVKQFKQNLTKFVGHENNFSCCTITDCAGDASQGYNKKDGIAIKTKSGNQFVNHEKYMDVMEVFKPNIYVTLSLSSTNLNSSHSSIEKSVNITNRLFESCLERHNQSEVLKRSGVIAPIQGGFNVQERIRSATFLSEYSNDVLGFLFDGFFTDGVSVEDIPSDLIIPVIDKTMEHLPSDKMKIIFGAWSPSLIVDLVNSGMDVFDTSLPVLVTKRSCALIFEYNLRYKNGSIVMDVLSSADDKTVSKCKSYELNLMEERHFDNFKPIKDSCACLTCKKHTISYLHHLLVSNELLGFTLLTIHNLHHYYQFFKDIREVLLKNNQ